MRRSQEDRADELLLDAWKKMQDGDYVPALESAGEAVYLDPRRPDGYLLLGDVHLREGNLSEAREAFEGARSKAGRRARDGGGDETVIEALGGLARCDLMAGAWEQAIGSLRRVLQADETDPLGVRQMLAEVQLLLGLPDACLEALPDRASAPADAWLVACFASLELGRGRDAVAFAHGALLRNPYLLACLIGEAPPDFGIVHGAEEGGAGFASDVVDRLSPYLEQRPDRLNTFSEIATTPTVMREVSQFVDLARSLNQEDDDVARESLVLRIAHLRDPGRIRGEAAQVLVELEADLT
ncbi:MAG: tetratricopeptide repeat protein [Planctomycetes bacterium]|nr:tetratricopeptide repeat protein [Planctomycetota bacterium]